MKVTKDNVEGFIRSFLNGETMNEEEAALYAFFRTTADLPDGLKMYKPMFAYFEGGLREEDLPGASGLALVSDNTHKERKKRIRRLIWSVTVGMAACFAGVMGVAHYEKQQSLYDSYEGSYVIDHGQRLSDIQDIIPRLQEVEQKASQDEERHKAERIEAKVLDGIDDPAVRAAAEEVFK